MGIVRRERRWKTHLNFFLAYAYVYASPCECILEQSSLAKSIPLPIGGTLPTRRENSEFAVVTKSRRAIRALN